MSDNEKSAEEILAEAKAWWTTEIIDIHPGQIALRGYAIQDLIGKISFAQMIWLMLRGELPTPTQGRLLEAALVASVDHGPHAPSIAIARIAATTGIELNNVMASSVNVLGDIHGGAGQQSMELYESIVNNPKSGTDLPAAVDEALSAFVAVHGKIIPGFGHRWHPIDPRCAPLLQLVAEAQAAGEIGGRYTAIGREVEAGIKRRTGKNIPMNIDGVTAVIFSELGFAAPLGRGLFVLSRSVGILSHAWEEISKGSRMKGPMPKSIPFNYAGKAPRKPE